MTDTEIVDYIDRYGVDNLTNLAHRVDTYRRLAGEHNPQQSIRVSLDIARQLGWLPVDGSEQ
jgi:hypothetical protein